MSFTCDSNTERSTKNIKISVTALDQIIATVGFGTKTKPKYLRDSAVTICKPRHLPIYEPTAHTTTPDIR